MRDIYVVASGCLSVLCLEACRLLSGYSPKTSRRLIRGVSRTVVYLLGLATYPCGSQGGVNQKLPPEPIPIHILLDIHLFIERRDTYVVPHITKTSYFGE